MFERFRNRTRRDTGPGETRTDRVVERPLDIRGGVTLGGILTGVVVSYGALFILSAIITGVLVALGLEQADITSNEAASAGIGVGIGLVVAQFLAYMWGGYTAGRMGRGAGIANGLLVAFVALLVYVIVAAIVYAVGATAEAGTTFRVNLPFDPSNIDDADAQSWGVGLGIASLLAMFIGGALGGALGSRWHHKLESGAYEERRADRESIDLRERKRAPAPPAGDTSELRREEAGRRV